MKVWNYVFISIGLIFLLYVAGYDVGSSQQIFDLLNLEINSTTRVIENVTIAEGGFFEEVFNDTGDNLGILAAIGLAVGGIIASFFSRTKGENFIILGFILAVLVLFVSALGSIMKDVIATEASWVSWLIVGILLPFTAGYILALIEFFRGTD